MRHDDTAPIAVEGMAYSETGVAAVAVFGEVWRILAIFKEEGISSFLNTQFCPIYH